MSGVASAVISFPSAVFFVTFTGQAWNDLPLSTLNSTRCDFSFFAVFATY
jgi:hypothetical protein